MSVNNSSLELYARNLAKVQLPPSQHNLACAETSVRVCASREAIRLTLCVDAQTHTVTEAFYTLDEALKHDDEALAHTLCRILKGLPLIEAQSHAVLKLEERMRDAWNRRPVAGIVQTANMAPIFSTLQQLIDDTVKEYRRQTGYSGQVSIYFESAPDSWSSQSVEQKHASILQEIEPFLKTQDIAVLPDVVCISDSRIEVDLPGVAPQKLPELLMGLEHHLFKMFGFPIEVMYHNMQDRNKKRI